MQRYFPFVSFLTGQKPEAVAIISGNTDYPLVNGFATFRSTSLGGVLIQVEMFHLPVADSHDTPSFFGMHIHQTGDCTPPFDQTGTHYNPSNASHPQHAGDLPPLLSTTGYAWSAFFYSTLTVSDLIGRSIIIHRNRDDFTSQPSGDSGVKIACGVIEPYLCL